MFWAVCALNIKQIFYIFKIVIWFKFKIQIHKIYGINILSFYQMFNVYVFLI